MKTKPHDVGSTGSVYSQPKRQQTTTSSQPASSLSIRKSSSSSAAKRRGRPSSYSEQLVDRICTDISEGITLKSIANKYGITTSTIYNWLSKHEYFRISYQNAKELYSELLFQDIMVLEARMLDGDITPAEFKAAASVRKWVLSKLSPKRFGDKLEVTATIDIASELEKRLNAKIIEG